MASKGLRPKWSLRNSPSCPISSLTGSGVASYLQLLVILLPRCCSNMQRCLLCSTTVLRFTIYGCINLLLWDVLLAALHLICNTPPKEDNLTGQMWFLNVVYYCEMNGKVHSRSMNWVSMEAYNWGYITLLHYIQLIANVCIYCFKDVFYDVLLALWLWLIQAFSFLCKYSS